MSLLKYGRVALAAVMMTTAIVPVHSQDASYYFRQLKPVAPGPGTPTGEASGPLSFNLARSIPTEAMVGVALPSVSWTIAGGKAPHFVSMTGAPTGLSATGLFEGAPEQAGNYTITLTARDSSDPVKTKSAGGTMTVYQAFSAVPSATPQATATVKQAIAPVTLIANGGKQPYSFSVVGNLPVGVGFDQNTGVLAGSPTQTGTYEFRLQAAESFRPGAPLQSELYTMVVAPEIEPLVLAAPQVLPDSISVGQNLNTTNFAVSGGTAPYSFTLESGSLPPGITLDGSTGSLIGAATIAGVGANHIFVVRVTDSQTTPATALSGPHGVNVFDPTPLVVTYTAAEHEGSPGTLVSVPAPVVTGGNAPFTYTGTPGPTVTASGAVSFNSASVGSFGPYTVTTTDAIGRTATNDLTFVFKDPPVIVAQNFAVATQTQANYSSSAAIDGGTGPFTWVLKRSGTTVPTGSAIGDTGLIWNAASGAIVGTVSATATTQANLTLQATDSKGRASATSAPVSLVVQPRPSGLAYATTTNATAEEVFTINPSAPNVGGTSPVTYAFTTTPTNAGISVDDNTGVVTVAATVPAGSYSFAVRATDANGAVSVASNTAQVVVAAKPLVTTASLPAGTQGSDYATTTLSWTGGNGELLGAAGWVLTRNGVTVPTGTLIGTTGLTWNASLGRISGTVAQDATPENNLAFTVRDSVGRTSVPKTLALSFALVPGAPTYGTAPASTGTLISILPSSASIGGSGGTTYEIVSITPANAGVTMTNTSTGQITINSTLSGTFTVSVRAMDSAGTYSPAKSFPIVVTAPVTPFVSGSQTLIPGGTFAGQIIASGGNGNFTTGLGRRTVTYQGTTRTSTSGGTSLGTFPGLPGQIYADLSYSITLPTTQKSLIGVQLTARDGAGAIGSATVDILASLVKASYATTASAAVGTAITVSPQTPTYGGTGALSYSVASTPAEPGITVNASTGVVTIASTVPAGSYSVVVTTTDGGTPSVGSIASTPITVSITSAPVVTRPDAYFMQGAQDKLNELYDSDDTGTYLQSSTTLLGGSVFARYAWASPQEISCVVGYFVSSNDGAELRIFSDNSGSSPYGPTGSQIGTSVTVAASGSFVVNFGNTGASVKQLDVRRPTTGSGGGTFRLGTLKAGRWNGTSCTTPN